MSNQETTIQDIQLSSSPNRAIRIKAGYSKGGTNYFTGGSNPRGFYADVTPITKLEGGGFSTILGSGFRVLIAPAARFSEKALDKAADAIRSALADPNSFLAAKVQTLANIENAKAPLSGAAELMAA